MGEQDWDIRDIEHDVADPKVQIWREIELRFKRSVGLKPELEESSLQII